MIGSHGEHACSQMLSFAKLNPSPTTVASNRQMRDIRLGTIEVQTVMRVDALSPDT